MDELKFVALDGEDLAIVSAHLQDAVLKVSDVIYRPQEKRLVLGLALASGRSWRWTDDDVFPADRDRPFRAVLWGRFDPGRRWSLSGRFQLSSGLPTT